MKHYKVFSAIIAAIFLVSCSKSSEIGERNKNMLIKIHEELLTNGNLAFADQAFASDYSFPGLELKGPELIKSYVADLKRGFPDLQYKLDHFVAEGNLVSWTRTCTGTHSADFMGYKATGKSVTWTETDVTRFADDGKVAEEWSVTDFDAIMSNASTIDGVYEYVSPMSGKGSVRNGHFAFLYGPANGSSPMVAQAGTYKLDGGKVISTYTYSTIKQQIGSSFSWRPKSWSGDTLTFEIYNDKGDVSSVGRSVRVSR